MDLGPCALAGRRDIQYRTSQDGSNRVETWRGAHRARELTEGISIILCVIAAAYHA